MIDSQRRPPFFVAGPSCESRRAGERQPYKCPNITGVWHNFLREGTQGGKVRLVAM